MTPDLDSLSRSLFLHPFVVLSARVPNYYLYVDALNPPSGQMYGAVRERSVESLALMKRVDAFCELNHQITDVFVEV